MSSIPAYDTPWDGRYHLVEYETPSWVETELAYRVAEPLNSWLEDRLMRVVLDVVWERATAPLDWIDNQQIQDALGD